MVLHGKLGEQTRAEAKRQKAARGRSMKERPTQSRKGVKGGLRPFLSAPCRGKGQRPLWGLGQRPNSSTGDQYAKRAQQRCRQRSVPASNFARPQTRPQAARPPSFREEPKKRDCAFFTQPRFLFLCNSQKRRARLIPPCPGRAPARCTARSMRRAWPSIRHESQLP